MSYYKLKPIKSTSCYRLIPTLIFIVASTSVVLSLFFMFVLQTGNAYDGESLIDDFKDDFIDTKSNEKSNLNIDKISLEDNSQILTTPQPSMQPFETFMLKKTINPTKNNHVETHIMRNMKAYKIVSKEPIIGNSLVKIVMAPQNVLEKLSKQQGNSKYVSDKIDKSANAPTKYYSDDGAFDRKLIQNVNIDSISWEKEDEDDGIKKAKQPEKNVVHHESNNIQVIAKSHKGPLNVNSKHRKLENSIDLKRFNYVEAITDDANKLNDKIEDANTIDSIDIEINDKKLFSEPSSTTSATSTDSNLPITYTEAEELLSNPTTSNNLVQGTTPGDVSASTEINSNSHQTNVEELENSSSDIPQMPLQDISTESNVPLVMLKILKNRTVLVEETDPQSIPDMLSMDTTLVPKSLPAVILPKIISRPITTTTIPPTILENKQKKFPKKVDLVDSYDKYKNLPRLDDLSMSLELTPSMSLLDTETTDFTPQSEAAGKNKNMKRAVGDEGTFPKIVRPSPIRQRNIIDDLRNETDVERTERLNKSLDRLLNFVKIVGQVDSLLTKRFRSGLKNVVRILDSVEDTRRRRSNSFV